MFVTESVNEKVFKSLEKLAEQQGRKLTTVEKGSVDDLKNLLELVAQERVRTSFVKAQKNLIMKESHKMKII